MKDVTTSVLVKMPQQESGNVPRGQNKQTNFVLFWTIIRHFNRNIARFEIHTLKVLMYYVLHLEVLLLLIKVLWVLLVHRCRVYSNLPKPYCYLIQDPSDACCQTPKCDFTASTNIHSGSYSAPVTVTQRPTTTPRPTTPNPSKCFWDSIYSMHIC